MTSGLSKNTDIKSAKRAGKKVADKGSNIFEITIQLHMLKWKQYTK